MLSSASLTRSQTTHNPCQMACENRDAPGVRTNTPGALRPHETHEERKPAPHGGVMGQATEHLSLEKRL